MTFNDILHKFRSESFTQKDKGTQFERLMRSWLLSDPRYSNLTKVWLWDDFPSRADLGGKDTGIDLVARTEEGDYWAIQCKCYKEDSVIDKPAVDSEEYRVSFSNSAELVTQLKKVDKLQYDIIAIVRGGGGGIEKLDDLKVLAAIIELKTPIIGAIGHVEEKLFIKQLVDKCAPTPNGLGQYFSEMVESANEKKTHSRAILTEQIKKQFKEQIDAGHKQNKELQEKLRVLTENQKKATEAQEIATKKHNEQVEAANKLNKELQDKLRVLTENQKKADEEQQIANKKHIEQIEAAQKQNQSLQEQLKTLNESQKKLQIIHQKQQEDLGKNLTKMQDANTLLQKSLEKATMQNAETLKELNHAKEQAKELEHSMSELKSKKGTNIWMWIAISAILILLCMLVL